MPAHLTLQELQAVVHLGDTRNFRAAAAKAHISQPALTRRIQSAESKLNSRLFDRSTHAVEITPAGTELLPIAEKILSEFTDSLSDLSEFIAGRRGSIRIAALASAAAALLPSAVAHFARTHPNVRIAIETASAEQIRSAVVLGQVDFGISMDPDPLDVELQYVEILKDEIVLICSRDDPIGNRKWVDWRIFQERPLVATGPVSSVRMITDRMIRQAGYSIEPRYESPNIALVAALVAKGIGVAAIPRLALGLLDTSQLTILSFRPRTPRSVGLLTRRGRSLPTAAVKFMESLGSIANRAGEAQRSLMENARP